MNYHAALAYFPKITAARYKKLFNYFGSIEAVWTTSGDELIATGLEANVVAEFISWRRHISVEKITAALNRAEIATIVWGTTAYPRLLAQISDPPLILFIRGQLPVTDETAVAIVGTRRCTPYGRRVTEELAGGLAQAGITIMSGLALGIDGIAHQTALNHRAKTIAVLGSGVDQASVCPITHQRLAHDIIASGGALISEYPPGFKASRYTFPMRNRIIAGLSLGTLVTEAPAKSGALITASCALDYNREVFAVPHATTSFTGSGGNNLIKEGAILVTETNDILKIFGRPLLHSKDTTGILTTPTEKKLLAQLTRDPQPIDKLIQLSGLDSGTAIAALTTLEIKGLLKNSAGYISL